MIDIKEFSTQELLDDKAASLVDIRDCQLALLLDIQEYSGGNVRERLEGNQNIVSTIEAELMRRDGERQERV